MDQTPTPFQAFGYHLQCSIFLPSPHTTLQEQSLHCARAGWTGTVCNNTISLSLKPVFVSSTH